MSYWPYQTICLPLAEVGSECESDYDCKPRNFCWKLTSSATEMKVCMEKHSAPDGTVIMWDAVKYPTITTEAVYFHGKYCQSGIAKRKSTNEAECVTFTRIDGNNT